MTIVHLEKQLISWQKLLLVHVGSSVTLLATAIADIPNQSDTYFPGWHALWFILQLATIIPAAVLVLGIRWRKLPFHLRVNKIFGYLGIGWITLVAMGVKLASSISAPLVGIGVVLGMLYWLLRKKHLDSPESLFP